MHNFGTNSPKVSRSFIFDIFLSNYHIGLGILESLLQFVQNYCRDRIFLVLSFVKKVYFKSSVYM